MTLFALPKAKPWMDGYLLRYRSGASIPPHRDKVSKHRHYRLNVILKGAYAGGVFTCDRPLLITKRIKLFRSDYLHSVTTVHGTRIVLSIGWLRKK
jgi:hypothetical protein